MSLDYSNSPSPELIDLHLHSTASDGYLKPFELMHYVKELGVTLCSLTDHDSFDGVVEAVTTADKIGIRCIPGIELSCLIDEKSVHLLGYFKHTSLPSSFLERLIEIQRWRAERNPKIIAKLCDLGMEITMEEVNAEADGGQVGRPHIARALLKKGFIKNVDQAFDLYLASGRPAYVEKDRLILPDAITMVHNAGGLAILAHPLVYGFMKTEQLDWLVMTAIRDGIDGVEAYYTEHRKSQRLAIEKLALENGLLITGGSDFHGPTDGIVKPGRGYGDLIVPHKYTNQFLDRIAALPV